MRLHHLLPLLAFVLLAGCVTPSESPDANKRAGKASLDEVKVEMTAEQVRGLVGEPAKIKATDDPAVGHMEVWVYQDERQESQMSATSMTEAPTEGPNGTIIMKQVPKYNMETVTHEISVFVVFLNGKVIEVKRAVANDRSFK